MHGFVAFLVLLVTLPLTLLAGVVGFCAFVVKLAFTFGLDAARWVLDPYPADPTEKEKEDDDRPPVIFSPRTAAEVLADAARKNEGAPLEVGTPPVPGGGWERPEIVAARNAAPAPDHNHNLGEAHGGGQTLTKACGEPDDPYAIERALAAVAERNADPVVTFEPPTRAQLEVEVANRNQGHPPKIPRQAPEHAHTFTPLPDGGVICTFPGCHLVPSRFIR